MLFTKVFHVGMMLLELFLRVSGKSKCKDGITIAFCNLFMVKVATQ